MKFTSPLYVMASKYKKFILNLNQYRNAHFRMLNNCKIVYKNNMTAQIIRAKKFNKVICLYTVYAQSNRKFDLGNVCCVHQKFFEDAFVELGKLIDDNIEFIPLVVYKFGGVDKENPRVEVEVLEVNEDNINYLKDVIGNYFGV